MACPAVRCPGSRRRKPPSRRSAGGIRDCAHRARVFARIATLLHRVWCRGPLLAPRRTSLELTRFRGRLWIWASGGAASEIAPTEQGCSPASQRSCTGCPGCRGPLLARAPCRGHRARAVCAGGWPWTSRPPAEGIQHDGEGKLDGGFGKVCTAPGAATHHHACVAVRMGIGGWVRRRRGPTAPGLATRSTRWRRPPQPAHVATG